MIGVILGVVWLGYGVYSWGWVLVKGYDIPAGQWFNVVHPYEWPPKGTDPPLIPAGSLLPPGTGATPGAAGQGGSSAAQAPAPHTPSPGQAPPVIGER